MATFDEFEGNQLVDGSLYVRVLELLEDEDEFNERNQECPNILYVLDCKEVLSVFYDLHRRN